MRAKFISRKPNFFLILLTHNTLVIAENTYDSSGIPHASESTEKRENVI
jgi:hypothetical protein